MRILSLAICLLVSQTIFAQPGSNAQPGAGTAAPKAPALPAAPVQSHALAWDATQKEFTVTNGTVTVPFDFSVTNVSKEDVIITGTQTSCGCTVASLPSQPWTLQPGSNGQIHVTLNVSGKTGNLQKSVMVYVSNAAPEALTIKAVIPVPPPMTEAERLKNQDLAKVDSRAIFKGSCADCHLTPSRGRTGAYLYETLCGVCHEAGERQASMVPNLHSLKHPTDYEFWKKTITLGKTNTLMPAFAINQGGPLSEAQIHSLSEYLARVISRNYSKPVRLDTVTSNGVPIATPMNQVPPIRPLPALKKLDSVPPVKKIEPLPAVKMTTPPQPPALPQPASATN